MSQDLISALGSRLESQLKAIDARNKAADSSRVQKNASDVAFVMPPASAAASYVAASHVAASHGGNTANSDSANAQNSSRSEIEVGATFRRKGELSDVPMEIAFVENGKVYVSESDGTTSRTIAFDQNEIEIVSKAPTAPVAADTEYFPNFIDLVKQAVVMETATAPATAAVNVSAEPSSLLASAGATDAHASVETFPTAAANIAANIAANVAAAADTVPSPGSEGSTPTTSTPGGTETPTTNTSTNTPTVTTPVNNSSTGTPSTTTPATTATPTSTADSSAPRKLADGTLQFGYAPTGGVINVVPNKTPPVSPDWGVGATFRRKGVLSDTPMTVTRAGDGVIFARPTFSDSGGLTVEEFAFHPNQLDLLTPAPH